MSKEQDDQLDQVRADAIKKLDTSKLANFTNLTIQQAYAKYSTHETNGLTTAQVQKQRELFGSNELEAEAEKGLWELIMEQFEDSLVRILLVAATISFVFALTGDGDEGLAGFVEPFVILLILVLNGIVAIWQEANAENALEALMDMQAQNADVMRDGKMQQIPAVELVPGDLVKVTGGDCVPADLRVTKIISVALQVSQASLTGESVNVSKNIKPLKEAPMLQDQKNMIFSSTDVKQGTAWGVVAGTGMSTAIGSVHSEVQAAKEDQQDTPLKQQIDKFGDQLAWVILIICVIVWGMNFYKFFDPIHGTPIKGCIYYLKIAIALAVAAIPEGLPAVITTCLALGTRKMAEQNCIVRRLNSVETLGCTSVICSDKTGTLTKNMMCATQFGTYGSSIEELIEHKVGENSYSPETKIVGMTQAIHAGNVNFRHMAACCALNSFATLEKEEVADGSGYKMTGSSTEGALKCFAAKLAIYDKKYGFEKAPLDYINAIKKEVGEVCTFEFSSERKTMSTVVTGYEGNSKNTVFLKGAGDRVLDKCTSISLSNGKTSNLSAADKNVIKEALTAKERLGLRVLGIAYAPNGGNMAHITPANSAQEGSDQSKYDQLEGNCTFLGYVAIKDPPREQVPKAILDCKSAGISVIMITGDAKETAIAIAKEIGILTPEQDAEKFSWTGAEFEKLSEAEKKKALDNESGKVFSRVEPRHKRELVKLLIDMGKIVAMTGDGVNDAPAIKQASIGIAMGITGTEVAKRASDMVLNDDNFATIVKAVEEGRSIYSNMKAFIRYLISSNIGEVLSIFFTAMLGIPEGFNSVQLLWVNLVTDGPPATALGFNPADKDIMEKPPRKSDDGLISTWTYFRYTIVGFYVGFATVGIFIYWYVYDEGAADGHTLVTLDQLMHWTDCPNWKDFQVNNFVEGLDFSKNPCQYFMKGKIKASTLSLSVLVLIEMLNAFNAISEDHSLLVMTPLVNPYLFAATAVSMGLHFVIVYVPVLAKIFSITALDMHEWWLVFAFSFPVIIIDEILKVYGRYKNAADQAERMKQVKTE